MRQRALWSFPWKRCKHSNEPRYNRVSKWKFSFIQSSSSTTRLKRLLMHMELICGPDSRTHVRPLRALMSGRTLFLGGRWCPGSNFDAGESLPNFQWLIPRKELEIPIEPYLKLLHSPMWSLRAGSVITVVPIATCVSTFDSNYICMQKHVWLTRC